MSIYTMYSPSSIGVINLSNVQSSSTQKKAPTINTAAYAKKATGLYNVNGTLVAVYNPNGKGGRVFVGKDAYSKSGMKILPVTDLNNTAHRVGDTLRWKGKRYKVVQTAGQNRAHLEEIVGTPNPTSKQAPLTANPATTAKQSASSSTKKTTAKKPLKQDPKKQQIKALQQALVDGGFYDKNQAWQVDGIIGRRTRKAMEKAKAAGYTIDGYTLVPPKKKQETATEDTKKETTTQEPITSTSEESSTPAALPTVDANYNIIPPVDSYLEGYVPPILKRNQPAPLYRGGGKLIPRRPQFPIHNSI